MEVWFIQSHKTGRSKNNWTRHGCNRWERYKKARYTLQVIAVCLYKLQKTAFKAEVTDQETIDHLAKRQERVIFQYWLGILNHEMNVLMLVTSFRESNLHIIICSCEQLVKVFFALDHTQYARWLPVFLQDLKIISVQNPYLFSEISRNFSVRTTKADLSDIAFDHKHEQLNKWIH